jgi:hypothetical protein
MDYGLYLPNYFDSTAFDIPSVCSNAKEVTTCTNLSLFPLSLFLSSYFLLLISSIAPSRGNLGKLLSYLSKDHAKPENHLEAEFQQFIQKVYFCFHFFNYFCNFLFIIYILL